MIWFQTIEGFSSYLGSLSGLLMRPRNAMSAFAMLAILMASTMGCIGLVPAREFMEDLRSEPERKDIIDKINASHTFTTDFSDIAGSTQYQESQSFEVDANVVKISAYIEAAIPGDLPDSLEQVIPRYVTATLTDADGNVVWSETLRQTGRNMVATFTEDLASGTWKLDIDARGYGEEIANQVKDSFDVLVTIESKCWQYPNEAGCSFDN